MSSSLTLRAGPDAVRLIRERGLRAEDVDVVPGASGGPRWLVLAGLDRMLFGDFFRARTRPLHLIGSSIGSWRLCCLALNEPVAALERFAEAYISQRYPPKPSAELVSTTSRGVLDAILGTDGETQILGHSWARLHVLTNRCRGLSASEQRHLQTLGLTLSALGNPVSRRTLGLQIERVIFHGAGDTSPFRGLKDLPSVHLPLTRENLRPALLASGSIPLAMSGVRIDGAGPGSTGTVGFSTTTRTWISAWARAGALPPLLPLRGARLLRQRALVAPGRARQLPPGPAAVPVAGVRRASALREDPRPG
ncbi:hypothetical protein ACN28S_41210 [Cystobacter fuscus]